MLVPPLGGFFFFNDTATPEIYTLSLHDALPISPLQDHDAVVVGIGAPGETELEPAHAQRPRRLLDPAEDRKSTRLNSSHSSISYAVFCLKKKRVAMKRVQVSPASSAAR